MARYVVNIDNSYKQPIPYHFTCNHCGGMNQKSYEMTVNVKASGSARNARGVQQLAQRQHDKQVKKSVREKTGPSRNTGKSSSRARPPTGSWPSSR